MKIEDINEKLIKTQDEKIKLLEEQIQDYEILLANYRKTVKDLVLKEEDNVL